MTIADASTQSLDTQLFGPAGDVPPNFAATTIELHSDDPTHPSTAGANAIPGALGPDGGSFAVTWQQPAAP